MSDAWFRTGHVTDSRSKTGCTVILFEDHVPAVVDVRGGAPGTRETTLLGAGQRGLLDAIVMSGGSAFGLRTADGVMDYLRENGRGLPTPAGPVPLVSAAIIYDLANGETTHPAADWGYSAAQNSVAGNYEIGQIGAGTGATVAKIGGNPADAGLGWGFSSSTVGDVSAAVVLNALGDVVRSSDGSALRAASDPDGRGRSGLELMIEGIGRGRPGENTTIGCVMVDGELDRYGLTRIAIAAHDGLARAIVPAHTPFDGDTFFAVSRASGNPSIADISSVCAATTKAVEEAIVGLFE